MDNNNDSKLSGFDSFSKGPDKEPDKEPNKEPDKEPNKEPDKEPNNEPKNIISSLENNTPEEITSDPMINKVMPEESSYTPPAFNFMPSGSYGEDSSRDVSSRGKYVPPAPYPIKSKKNKPVRVKKDKKPKGERYGVGVILLAVLLAAIIGAGAGVGSFAVMNAGTVADTSSVLSSNTSSTEKSNTIKTINIASSAGSIVEAVAEKAGPSVVGIRTTTSVNNFFGGSNESADEGSGVIYSTDGYIITNYHVIEGATNSSSATVNVYLPSDAETAISATIVGYNIASDLAVLKINETGLPAIEIGDSEKLSVGEYAVAIGNPGGLEFMGSVTYGIISGLNRSVTVEGVGEMSLIQTDAAINPGNSGGALCNSKGMLIGINSTKLVSTSYEGMGFAIPVRTVVEICDDIISKENKPAPYIGITLSTLYDSATLEMLGYPNGAVVQGVAEESPASECDIQRGDIITEFANETIIDYKTFNNIISSFEPGDVVTVQFYRSGKYYSTSITIGANNER